MLVIYILVIVGAIIVGVLFLRIRLRIERTELSNSLFIGLGRSGLSFDFASHTAAVQLFGITVKRIRSTAPKKAQPEEDANRTEAAMIRRPEETKKESAATWQEHVAVGSRCAGPLWKFAKGLLKRTEIEECEAVLTGGFEQPHLTGAVFGCYQAALATAPTVFARIQYVPDWERESFNGRGRIAVALPLYELVAQATLLVCRLPKRQLLRLMLNKQKGAQNVKQRGGDS
ncbi:MAG TPA: hypothetical protein VN285_02720 [Candidatus Deferrimicrobium sp.]|nr:hypothetical protein [Candidatus Deferrimicrobium sp.]